MNPLRLEQMTIFDVEPAEVVTIAAELDVPSVSFFIVDMEGARPVTPANKRSVIERLRDAPVRVETIEAVTLGPDARAAEAAIALGAELGARTVVALNLFEANEERVAEHLAALCVVAADYGMNVSLEFISMAETRTLAQAERAVRRSGAANARITVDVLHVMRTGAAITEVAALDPALVGSAQICDGPIRIAPREVFDEAVYSRMAPGEGAFPLVDFLRSIADSVSLGVEAPLRARREAGMSARDRSRLVIEATRTLQARAAAP